MIKDPLFTKMTPYDILGLSPDANHDEVHKALPLFMRDPKKIKKFGIGMAQESVKQLKNPNDRIEIDIFYYSVGAMSEMHGNDGNQALDIKDFVMVPVLNDDAVCSDLDRPDISDEYTAIVFNKLKLSELNKYDNQTYDFVLSFDK